MAWSWKHGRSLSRCLPGKYGWQSRATVPPFSVAEVEVCKSLPIPISCSLPPSNNPRLGLSPSALLFSLASSLRCRVTACWFGLLPTVQRSLTSGRIAGKCHSLTGLGRQVGVCWFVVSPAARSGRRAGSSSYMSTRYSTSALWEVCNRPRREGFRNSHVLSPPCVYLCNLSVFICSCTCAVCRDPACDAAWGSTPLLYYSGLQARLFLFLSTEV